MIARRLESETEQEVEFDRSLRLERPLRLPDSSSDSSPDYGSGSEESYSDDSMILDDLMLGQRGLGARLGRGGGRFLLGGRVQQAMREAAAFQAMAQQQRRQPGRERERGRTCTVYFTKNGERVGETECEMPRGGFYPVVAMLSLGEKIRVNFNPLTE